LDEQSAKAPRYALSHRQKTALSAAIAAAKSPAKERTPDALVNQALARFNCVACHDRNKQGGVLAARDAFFLTDMPEMGDEGRIPPSLTGVGAKLTAGWLKTLLDEGAKDRPYMFTRMPKFGASNVGELVAAFEAADATQLQAAPVFHVASDDGKRVKAAGRRLVGSQGFACIKCHTFAGHRSTGIQAISMTTMTRRLRPEWFHYYLQNPLAYRPGTRMPTPFPDGKTTLPSVLDGTVEGQMGAIWTYLADGDKALFPVGLVTGKIELIAFDEAVVYRNFLEGAGTRAIGVGYPEKLNLAFDANHLRLALLWHGGFIDAARHWTARGAGFEKPLGDNVLRLPDGPPLAVLDSADAPWPDGAAKDLGFKFEGYRLDQKRQPTFQYSWQQVTVEDEPRPIGEQDVFSMQRRLTFRAVRPLAEAWFRAMRAEKIDELNSGLYRIDDRWTLKVLTSGRPRVREQDGMRELLIPLTFDGNKAQIELTYDW
jgi:mono/diheme cytochrome c family protein